MVFYYYPRGYEEGRDDYLIYMGRDKHENEDLIRYGLPVDVWWVPSQVGATALAAGGPSERAAQQAAMAAMPAMQGTPSLQLSASFSDCRFHVDNLSSAHVYLRLPENVSIEDIPAETLEDCCQLVKQNSIAGAALQGAPHALGRVLQEEEKATRGFACMGTELACLSNSHGRWRYLPSVSSGCKQNTVDIIYTMHSNLKKTSAMEVGQVSAAVGFGSWSGEAAAVPPGLVSTALSRTASLIWVVYAHMHVCITGSSVKGEEGRGKREAPCCGLSHCGAAPFLPQGGFVGPPCHLKHQDH
jgi:hypothetical protein